MTRSRLLVPVLVTVNGLYALNQMVVMPALPTIERELHTTTTRVTWTLSVFLIVSCVATPIIGRLSDQFGPRRMLLGVLVVFFLGSVLAATATNVWVLIAARALQAGSGALSPLAIGLLSGILPPAALQKAIGAVMSVTMIGTGLGAAISGLVLDWAGWRYPFLVSAGAVLACLAALWRITPRDRPGDRAPIDIRGAVLLSSALVSLLVALTEGAHWGWLSPGIVALGATSVVVFAAWLRHERRVPFPLVDVRALSRRTVVIANVAQSFSAFAMTAIIVLVPRLAITSPDEGLGYGLGASSTLVGLYLLPISASGLVAGRLANAIGRRFGFRACLTTGQLIGAAALGVLIPWHDHGWQLVLVMLGFGLTVPLVNTAVNTLVVEAVRGRDVGASTGILVVFRQIGATVGAQLTAGVLSTAVVAGTTLPTEVAFQLAFAIGVGGAVFGTSLVLTGMPRGGRPQLAGAAPASRTSSGG